MLWSVVVVVVVVVCVGVVRGEAVLRDNGYEDVVVTIGEDVPEDARIINNIKRMFEDGSRVLDIATRHRAHFRNVTLVVPASWTHLPHYQQSGVGVGGAVTASVHVDLPHPRHGNTPYTLQLGGCGHPGQYIHLSPEYAAHMYDDLGLVYGPPGKVLVHEWAHLRWGVFDEYPTSYDQDHAHAHAYTNSPTFYVGDDGMVRATGCSEDVVGWARTEYGTECRVDQSGLPDTQCHFYPAHNNTARGSLMGLYHLDSVELFCDNDEVPHNSVAPTPHNLLCGGQSVWEVITQHPDFHVDRNLPRKKREAVEDDLKPNFLLVQEEKLRFILLLDISGSMESYMNQLYQAVVGFVRYLAPAGSKMAVVSFFNTTRLDLPFTLVPEGRREELVAKLPATHEQNGYTAIGSAVKLAVKLLESDGEGGGAIVLVTDGEETVRPLVSTVLPSLKAARLPLSTIAFGPFATDSLEIWARETGGRSYYHSTKEGVTSPGGSLDTQLFEAVSHAVPVHSQRLVQVYRKTHVIGSRLGESVEGKVMLDSSLGHRTHLTFTQAFSYHTTFSVDVEVEGADGVHYGNWSDSEVYQADPITRIIAISIPSAQTGVWKYKIKRTKLEKYNGLNAEVRVLVTSYPLTHTPQPPVRVDAGLVMDDNGSYPAPALVVATVTQGRRPVLGANATALIVPPPTTSPVYSTLPPTTIRLRDDGLIGDREAGDGVYSGYFTQFTGNGRYSLSIIVSATNHTSALGDAVSHSSSSALPSRHVHHSSGSSAILSMSLPLPENALPPPNSAFNPKDFKPPQKEKDEPGAEDGERKVKTEVTEEGPRKKDQGGGGQSVNSITKVEPFTRVVSGGIFKVHNYKPGDQQPPGKVQDLQAKVNKRKLTTTLTFTSTGDDLYTGTASSLELRYHHTSVMRRDFLLGTEVNESHFVSGNLTPLPAMATHTLTLKVPDLYAHNNMRDGDEEVGKVIYFMLRAQDETGNVGEPSNLATAYFPPRSQIEKVKKKEHLEAMSGLIVLVVLAAVILALVIFTCSLKYLHAKRKREKSEQDLLEGGPGGSVGTLRSARGTLRTSTAHRTSGSHKRSSGSQRTSGSHRGASRSSTWGSGTVRGSTGGYQYENQILEMSKEISKK